MEFEKYEINYKIDKNKSYIRFLGENFFKRNNKYGNIIYENKKFPLMEKIEKNIFKKDKIKIDLIFYKIIYNKSYMFKDCDSLMEFNKINYTDKEYCSIIINIYEEESLFDYINESTYSENTLEKTLNEIHDFPNYSSIKAESQNYLKYTTIPNISNNLSFIQNDKDGKYILTGMFYNCFSLISVSGINNWDYAVKYEIIRSRYLCICGGDNKYIKYEWKNNNISDMSGIFYNCSSLKSLPDISDWDTNNITNMSTIFYNCSSLISLPDISEWNTERLINMGGIFSGCSSLKSLPDISKWSTNKVTNLSAIFYNCSSLISLPDISKWNTRNVNYMSGIFYNCSSLISLPDISKWNTNKVSDMSALFYKCHSLSSLPDISIWNTVNVTDMHAIFYECLSLLSLPDISIWGTNNVTNMKEMFYNCLSLSIFPDISIWNCNHVKNSSNIFYNCLSLLSIIVPNVLLENESKGEKDKNLKLLEQIKEEKKIEVIFEKMIDFRFNSELRVNFPISCRLSDSFSKLEEKLYFQFSNLKNKNIYFIANGIKINRNLTLEKNKIKNGNHISVYYN